MALRNDVAKIEQHYLLDMLDVTDSDILEIGCGEGRLTWQYADLAHSVIAIDVEFDRLKEGLAVRPENLESTVAMLAGSAIVLPFANQSFDHVILAWSF